MNNICTCTCHHNPLLWHFNNCCEHTGKLYINDDGTVDMKRYLEITGKKSEKTEVCPCCGGSGHAVKTC